MLIPIFLLMFLIITNKDSFQKYFSKDILEKLSVSNRYMGKTTRNILMFISLILMIIALSRPVMNEKEQSFEQEVASIVIAIDVSKSMLANDIYPNRLTMAKQKLLNIIEESKQNALAVILFAKSSFILSPVTQDFNSLKILVENLNTGMNFDNGSNIFSTLEATNKLLKDYENKNLLLLTDGGNATSYEKEIEYAKENKINVYTIAIATNKASAIKLDDGKFLTKEDGSIVTVALNENIKKLSLNTNGGYINYSINNSDLKQILDDIEQKSVKKQIESKKFKTYTELFYYPLALAIFILFIAFSSLPKFLSKKVTMSIIVLSLFFISTNDLRAFEFDFETIKKANKAYENNNFEKASKNFDKVLNTPEARYNYANSLYKEKKYKEALMQYKNVTTSNKNLEYKKLHNMGNSYVKLNDLENAKKMYENALKIQADKETRENLEKVQDILDKIKKQKNKDNQNQKEKKKNQDKKEQNKENQDKKKNQEDNKENQKEDKNQEENSQKNESSQQQKQNMSQSQKPKELSDLEEKKWLEKLENKKSPVLLKKVKTKNEDTSSNPW
ncbi:vWA domain-containing protein [Arcobacter arenosus]|uniref:VWA domain-containing protein n=1 Tax=Arcobacter arenosus TaxID=2576037 RepID=A0A5R8XYS7_9BACT|nr:VWA domain-containing protein [Arcobacter arenosus]TLP36932.1 VWA domain-containing protein [Arcobacter arenosus]